MRRGVVWSIVLSVTLAACHAVTPQEEASDVCTALCKCLVPVPDQQGLCIQQCTAQIPSVTPACLECTTTNEESCPMLVGECLNACTTRPMP